MMKNKLCNKWWNRFTWPKKLKIFTW